MVDFTRHLDAEAKAAIERYQDAKLTYSKAAKEIARLRIIAEHPEATSEDLVRYMKGKKDFKAVCKAFHVERSLFQRNIQLAQGIGPSATKEYKQQLQYIPDNDAIESLQDYSHREMQQLKERCIVSEDVKSGKYDELLKQVEAIRSGIEIPKESYTFGESEAPIMNEKKSPVAFRSSKDKNDPTLGDFEPL